MDANSYELDKLAEEKQKEIAKNAREYWKWNHRERQNRPECSVEGCANEAKAKGLCAMHYQRNLRKGNPLADAEAPYLCKVEACERQPFSKGLCVQHFILPSWRRT